MDILQEEEEKIARIMQEIEDETADLLDSPEFIRLEEEVKKAVSTKNLNDLDILESVDSEPVQEEEKKEQITDSETKGTSDIKKGEIEELTTPEGHEVITIEEDITMKEVVTESEKEEVKEFEKEEQKEEAEKEEAEKEEAEKEEEDKDEDNEEEKEVEKAVKKAAEKVAEKEKATKKTQAEASEDERPKRGRKPKKQYKRSKKEPSLEPEDLDEPEQSDDSEEPEEPEQYEIENIVGHKLYKSKVVKYIIQWKGYGPEDNTTESADSIHDDVPELCAAYWDSLPSIPRPLNAPVSKNSKRKRITTEEKASVKKHKGNLEHVPQHMLERGFKFPKAWPNEDLKWETHIKRLCAIQLSPIDKSMKLAYIEWINGERTIHTLEECHKKCPMQLINYYEERLRFI